MVTTQLAVKRAEGSQTCGTCDQNSRPRGTDLFRDANPTPSCPARAGVCRYPTRMF